MDANTLMGDPPENGAAAVELAIALVNLPYGRWGINEGVIMVEKEKLIASRDHVVMKNTGINSCWVLLQIKAILFIELMKTRDAFRGL